MVVLALLAVGCGKEALTPAAQNVVVQKSDAPDGCTEVGFVTEFGSNFNGKEMHEVARTKLRNRAAEKGGNYLRLESVIEDGNGVKYTGTVYDCRAK